ncbi:MAG TPA: MBL fold metallo-hydrolase [Vicinamibacterales bacterium]|nr:MBL fold metallo-hydrolase [Vicinamibacterales bacterium]
MSTDTFEFRVGRFMCLALLDGTFRYPPELFFSNLPRDQYESRLGSGEGVETIEVPYICLYIDTGRQRVLVDTGAAGFGPTTGRLPVLLQQAGIDRSAIDIVVLSHGHPDHIGGNLDDRGELAFPSARHVMTREEWAYWDSGPSLDELPAADWLKQLVRATAERNLPPMRRQLDLITADAAIAPGISALATPGHTPGHIAVQIESEGERLLFLADTVLHPLDVEYPDTVAVFDHSPARMVATRQRILAGAEAAGTLVMASHLPFPALGHIVSSGVGWRWVPLVEGAPA